jgi:hypothetical protein
MERDRIHRFHDGANRDLFTLDTFGKNSLAVPAAIAKKLVERAEVSAQLLEALKDDIEHISQYLDDPEGPSA